MTLVRSALAVLVVVAGSACGGSDGPAARSSPDPGPVHVHGLGVNPRDGALFVATHTGLWRLGAGESRASRVGDRRQDTMGFTVVGPDRFLGSGHPDLRDGLPPLLGLLESSDAGRSWTSISLLGDSDFHTLRARGGTVYGVDGVTDLLFVSRGGGTSWERRKLPARLLDLAIDPEDPKRVIAAGATGLLESLDAGSSWNRLGEVVGLLAWPSRERLYLLDGAGTLWVATDAGQGRSWRSAGRVEGEPAAFTASGDTLYVAFHDGTVSASTDGGASWSLRTTP